ncbi:zinc finger BED domain-containing protein RICESLEEPER 2-like [Rhizophagus irregularis DAOM 181602=DAOM 197198]|nr:zinc finger BED domain-containing protein RICESLEEPER 2-like [Rhizophagus irregularis DAOM 181602=DAOM 197198]
MDINFNNDAYLGLTIHFIDNNWNLEFQILKKTLVLTTDNESAMIICGKIIIAELTDKLNNQSFHHYRCSAYILNLAAQQGIKIINNLIDTLIIFEPLEKATVLLLAFSYPAISDIRFLFFGIQQHLDDYIGKKGFNQIATTLDPHTKLALFATGEESTNAVNAIKSHFAEYNVSPLLTSLLNTNQETVSNCEYFHQLKRKRLAISDSQTERSVRRSRSSEIYKKLNRYLCFTM